MITPAGRSTERPGRDLPGARGTRRATERDTRRWRRGVAYRGTAAVALAIALSAGCLGVSATWAGVVRTIGVGQNPYGIASDGTHVWVANNGDGTVSEIDAGTGAVLNTIPVGGHPLRVSADGSDVWVANDEADEVTEIDESSGSIVRTIPVEHPFNLSSDGSDVWVTQLDAGTVTEIEAATGTVLRTIEVGANPRGVSADGTHVWVASSPHGAPGLISEIDASTGTISRTIAVAEGAYAVASDGTNVWVTAPSSTFEKQLTEIDGSSGTVSRTVNVGNGAEAVTVDGSHVWTANYAESTVSEVEASTGVVHRTIPIGSETEPIGISSDGTHVWVASFASGTVSEIEPPAPGPGCATNLGTVRLSPGLTDTPAIQTLKIKAEMKRCSEEPFGVAQYSGQLKTTAPVSCSVLTEPGGAAATGAIKLKWKPAGKASKGTLSMTLLEGPASFSGEVTAGGFAPLPFTGAPALSFLGGVTCGQPAGGKPAKPVKSGSLGESEISF